MAADGEPFLPFRSAVLDSKDAISNAPFKTYGQKGRILMFSATLLLAAMAAAFGGSAYSRVEKASGVLSPGVGVLAVASPRSGTLSHLFVREGMEVVEGAPLASISLDTNIAGGAITDQLAEATNLQEGAAHQVAIANADVLARRLDDARVRRQAIQDDQRDLQSQRVLVARQLELARDAQQRAQTLVDSGVYTKAQLNQSESATIQATLAVSSVDQRLRNDGTQLRQIDLEEQSINAQMAEAKAQQDSAAAQMREKRVGLESQRAIVLNAVRSGRITAIQAQEGQAVSGGAPLALLVPRDSKLVAQVWLPSSSVAFVKSGDPVRVMYDSFPYQQFGVATGHVSVISTAPVPTRDLPVKSGAEEALYPVSIALDRQSMHAFGRDWPLLPGMKLNVTIVLEKRSMLQWIFAPVSNALGGY